MRLHHACINRADVMFAYFHCHVGVLKDLGEYGIARKIGRQVLACKYGKWLVVDEFSLNAW